jgi:Arylsulfatase A and related enzymes
VVIILADDLGWHDVGYHGSEIRTPNIDRLASEGVRLERAYSFPVCSPTRSGLMTGRSPMRLGVAYTVIRPWSTYGVPLAERFMPQAFQAAGYQTAITGKWHLGHARKAFLPRARGFDHAYGHLNGAIDYFTHEREGGLDWNRDGKSVREEGYTTFLLAPRQSVSSRSASVASRSSSICRSTRLMSRWKRRRNIWIATPISPTRSGVRTPQWWTPWMSPSAVC